MNEHDEFDQVRIELLAEDLSLFHHLLRQGLQATVHLGTSVQQVLTQDLHIPQERVDRDIQSIFLNGHPVDDLDTVISTPESVLTLSAAMPGLVGACLRRGGTYAKLRQAISWHEEPQRMEKIKLGIIKVKLFNLMVSVLGPILLSRGLWVETERLANVLDSEQGYRSVYSVQVNGEKKGIRDLLDTVARKTEDMVFLQVNPLLTELSQ